MADHPGLVARPRAGSPEQTAAVYRNAQDGRDRAHGLGNADVSTGGVQIMKFGEYIHTLYVPTSLNLCKVRPLRGTS